MVKPLFSQAVTTMISNRGTSPNFSEPSLGRTHHDDNGRPSSCRHDAWASANSANLGQTINFAVAVNGSYRTGSVTLDFGRLSWVCEDVGGQLARWPGQHDLGLGAEERQLFGVVVRQAFVLLQPMDAAVEAGAGLTPGFHADERRSGAGGAQRSSRQSPLTRVEAGSRHDRDGGTRLRR
jgi:hypothetical protein